MKNPRQLIQNIKRQIITEEENSPVMEPLARRSNPVEQEAFTTSEGILEAVKKKLKRIKNKVVINPIVDETIHPNHK